jgi:hypothetical protein
MPQRRGNFPPKQTAGIERLVELIGAENDIAPFDDSAAFGKKAGELIARSAGARKARKQPQAKVGRVDVDSQARKLIRDD